MKTDEGRSRRQRGRHAGRCTRPMTASCLITLQQSPRTSAGWKRDATRGKETRRRAKDSESLTRPQRSRSAEGTAGENVHKGVRKYAAQVIQATL